MVSIPLQENQLVQALQAGQASAFTTLYDTYAPTLFKVLIRMVADQARAEDLLQDTFVKVWINRHHYDANQGKLFTWLLTITRNTALSELAACKTQNKIRAYTQRRCYQQTNTQTTDTISHYSLFDLVAPKYRQILELTFQGYTKEEIAIHCRLPLGTVKTRYRTAIQELKFVLRRDIDYYVSQ